MRLSMKTCEHHLSLVDDLNAAAIKRMKAEGFCPSLVIETSTNNFQAWLNLGQVLPRRISTIAARSLAAKFGGDKGAADWRHFGRLAGFTNRKAKYHSPDGTYPFVRIIAATPAHVYTSANNLLDELHKTTSAMLDPSRTGANASSNGRLLTIDHFRSNPTYGGDGNRIDLAYSVYVLAHGVTESEISPAIASSDLARKGSPTRQSAYATSNYR